MLSLSSEQLLQEIEKHKKQLPRLQKLYDYYIGKHDILNRKISDPLKPNNKVVVPYATTIINTAVSYLIGKPVTYVSKSNNNMFIKDIKEIFYANDEEDVNATIVKYFSILGKTYELYWISDKEGEDIRFKHFSPLEMIILTDADGNITHAIRYGEKKVNGENILKAEIYDDKGIYYRVSINKNEFIQDPDRDDKAHYWGEVPVNVFYNNDEEIGDFETVIESIDNIELLLSNESNEIEQWVNSLLVIAGHKDTKEEDITAMREQMVLLLDDIGQAKYLTKEANTDFQSTFFSTLDDLIHEHTATPKMTSENFSSNLSSPALGYKLFGLESKSVIKERKMEKALKKRIRLICKILNKKGKNYDPSDIAFNFVRNIPPNKAEITDQMVKLAPFIDERTLLSMHPDLVDVDTIIKRKREETNTTNEEVNSEVTNQVTV